MGNPLTHSGRVLAANPNTGKSSSPSPRVPPAGAFVLVTTVFASPGNALATMATMPSLFKLGSVLFPQQLQQSDVVNFASSAVACSTLMLQSALERCKKYRIGTSTGTNTTAAQKDTVRAPALAVADTVAYCICVLGFVLFDLTIGAGFVLYHGALFMLQVHPRAGVMAVLALRFGQIFRV